MNKKDLEKIIDIVYNRPAGPAGRGKRYTKEPYMDYAKSYASQSKGSPTLSAVTKGIGYGALGSLLGGLAGHLGDGGDDHSKAKLGAILGAIVGGGAGAYSGYRGQESANSKANAIKRLGKDSPMEYEALLEYPALAEKITSPGYAGGYKQSSEKQAQAPSLAKLLAGTAAGGIWGGLISPKIGDYEDNKAARWASILSGAAAGGLMATPGQMNHGLQSLAAGEFVPMGLKAVSTVTESMKEQAEAAKGQNQAILDAGHAQASSTKDQLADILTSDAAKGAGMGAAVSGLGAIVTGLLRARNDDEIKDNKTRLDMVADDFATYLLPSAIAGGVGNYYANQP